MSCGLLGAMAEALDSVHTLQTNARYRRNAVATGVPDEISKHIVEDIEAQERLQAASKISQTATSSNDPLANAVLTALDCFSSFWQCDADDRTADQMVWFEGLIQELDAVTAHEKELIQQRLQERKSPAVNILLRESE